MIKNGDLTKLPWLSRQCPGGSGRHWRVWPPLETDRCGFKPELSADACPCDLNKLLSRCKPWVSYSHLWKRVCPIMHLFRDSRSKSQEFCLLFGPHHWLEDQQKFADLINFTKLSLVYYKQYNIIYQESNTARHSKRSMVRPWTLTSVLLL